MIYTDIIPEPSIASREKGVVSLLYCIICGRAPEGNDKIRTHYFPEPEENKIKWKTWNTGHHNVPEIRDHVGKVP